MDDADRRPAPPSGIRSKVIRGDAVANEVPLADKPRPRGAVVNAEEFEAKTTAQQIVADAHKKAEEILAEAQKQKEKVFNDARADAKAEVVAKSSEEIARAKMQAGEILAASEKDILDLSLKVAAKIIGRDLERDPLVLTEICATAIEHARAAKAIVLRVNPKDGATLREKRPRLMEQIGRTVEIAIRDDADVQVGGCIIQTEFGTIDAQLKTQFEMLRNLFYGDKKDGPA